MLHAEYVRDIHNNYLVIKGLKDHTCGYRTKILLNNTIEGLLKVELKYIDQMDLFYYNINNKKSLASAYENKSLQYEDIKKLLESILKTINGSGEYLLSENDFIIDPEYIFVEDNLEMVYMCYLEGYQTNMLTQFSKFMEYLMNKVDYKDENAVVLTYGLYKESREEDCTYEKLMKELMKELQKKQPLQGENSSIRNDDKNGKDNINHNAISQDKKYEKYPDYNKENYGDSRRSDIAQKRDKLVSNKKEVKDNEKNTLQELVCNNPIFTSLFGSKQKKTEKSSIKNNGFNNKIHKTEENKKHLQNRNGGIQGNEYPFIEEVQSDKEILVYEKKTYIMALGAILLGAILILIIVNLKLLHNAFGTQIDSVKLIGFLLIICSGEIYIFSKIFNPNNRITKMVSSVEYIEPNLEEVLERKGHRGLYLDQQSSIDSKTQSETQSEIQSETKSEIQSEIHSSRENEKQSDQTNYVHSDMITASELRIEIDNNEDNNQDRGQEDTIVLWKEEENDSDKTKILADLTPKKQYYLEPVDSTINTVIPIREFPFIIGKLSAGVNHRIQDQAVSRRHVKFMKEKEDIYVIDLGSTNGTFLNGIRLTNHKLYKLYENDEILIAQYKFYWKIST